MNDQDYWRSFYAVSAQHGADWVQAHGWGYSARVAEQTIDDIRRKLALRDGDRVLDVGCASGIVLDRLLDRPQHRGVGIDNMAGWVRKARTFGVDSRRVALLIGDAAALPLADATFDRVLCYSVFLYFPTTSYAMRVVRELLRVCRPGGTVLIGDIPSYVRRVTATWRRKGLGLEVLRAALRVPWLLPLRIALSPLRMALAAARRLRTGTQGDPEPPDYRWYSEQFFRRLERQCGCEVEILPQAIPGRVLSLYRFDVRITKPRGEATFPSETTRRRSTSMWVGDRVSSAPGGGLSGPSGC